MAALVEVGLSMGVNTKVMNQVVVPIVAVKQSRNSSHILREQYLYNVVTSNDDDPSLLAKPPANSLPYRDIESRFFVQQFT
jgi:hypothetical protein